MIRFLIFIGLLSPLTAQADAVIAANTIPSRSILGPMDVFVANQPVAGALTDPADAVGMEARVVLYAGRPIRAGDLVPPALVDRNDIVVLVFKTGPLTIAAEGRALERGAEGARIRVMNLSSRATVSGTINAQGQVLVGPSANLLAQVGDR